MENKEIIKNDIIFIEACVNSYMEFLGDAYTLARYEVHPWNYFSYRTIAR